MLPLTSTILDEGTSSFELKEQLGICKLRFDWTEIWNFCDMGIVNIEGLEDLGAIILWNWSEKSGDLLYEVYRAMHFNFQLQLCPNLFCISKLGSVPGDPPNILGLATNVVKNENQT